MADACRFDGARETVPTEIIVACRARTNDVSRDSFALISMST
jgi:hypothetical protein